MKKIVVTAPTSVVGSNFINYARRIFDIITVGRRESDITFDFSKDDELVLPDNIESVVHIAGVLHAESDMEILDMFQTNVTGMLKACIAAKKSGVKHIVLLSSISACLEKNSAYFSYYSLTKRQAEEAARLYCSANELSLCIIRPSQIFGYDWRFSKSQPLLYHMMEVAKAGLPITIYGKHDALRNYIFADNLYQLITHVIEQCIDGEIDAIDRRNYKLSETAQIIVNSFQSSSPVEFLADKTDIPDNPFYTETDYFEKWKIPFTDFEKAMGQIAKYYKEK